MNTATRARRPAGYGSYVDGANALQIAEPIEAPAPLLEPAEGRTARRKTPWVSDVTEVAEKAAPAPLPIALPRAPFLTLMVGLVVVGVLGVLVLNTKINENSFRLNDLRSSQGALDLQQAQLERDLANLESPGNLRAAATRIGLVPASTPAFISLPDGRVVGVPQPASGELASRPAGTVGR